MRYKVYFNIIRRINLSVRIAGVKLDTVCDLRRENLRQMENFNEEEMIQRKVTKWFHLYSWLTSQRRFVTF